MLYNVVVLATLVHFWIEFLFLVSKVYLISNVTIHSILTTSFIQLPKEHILDIKYITCHVVNKSVVS